MIKIIVVIIVAMISSFSYYGAVNEKGEKVVDLTTNIQEENVVENESVEETQGNIIEQIGKHDFPIYKKSKIFLLFFC